MIQINKVANGINIFIDEETLRCTVESHPSFWDGERGISVPNIKISDLNVLTDELILEFKREDEDGSTAVTKMFDKVIVNAIENGCEGFDLDEMELRLSKFK